MCLIPTTSGETILTEGMSQETKDYLAQVKRDKKARDEGAQMERQAKRHVPNRMLHVQRVVNKYLDNTRRFRAGDPEAVPPWEFVVRFN